MHAMLSTLRDMGLFLNTSSLHLFRMGLLITEENGFNIANIRPYDHITPKSDDTL